MTRVPSSRLRVYLALAGAAAIAGLGLGRPELVAVAAPFAAYAAAGIALHRPLVTRLGVSGLRARALEGDELMLTVELFAEAGTQRVAVSLRPAAAVEVISDPPRDGRVWVNGGEASVLRWAVQVTRWGVCRPGTLACTVSDRFGLFDYELAPLRISPVRVFPRIETLRALLDPVELQPTSGSRVSRVRGEGTEFAEVRPFLPGDQVRRINWRITARRGALHVSERHPERNTDVILFLDTFTDIGDAHRGTLDSAVRAAASLAAAYLGRKDRVGVVGFGGVLTGLGPRLGQRQLYRILDALMGSEVVFSYADKDVTFVPRGLLPPKSLVIAITPLIDPRSIGALLDLRARGFDLAVLEVSPVPHAQPGRADDERLAYRLWLLRREVLRGRLEALGVPVAQWDSQEAVQIPLLTAAEFRRKVRRRVAA